MDIFYEHVYNIEERGNMHEAQASPGVGQMFVLNTILNYRMSRGNHMCAFKPKEGFGLGLDEYTLRDDEQGLKND